MDGVTYALSLIGVGTFLVAFAFTNFATKDEVQKIHKRLDGFSTRNEVEIIQKKLDTIDGRVFQILSIIKKDQ